MNSRRAEERCRGLESWEGGRRDRNTRLGEEDISDRPPNQITLANLREQQHGNSTTPLRAGNMTRGGVLADKVPREQRREQGKDGRVAPGGGTVARRWH